MKKVEELKDRKLTIRMSEKMYIQLEKLHIKEDISIPGLVRKAIKIYLENKD